MRFMIAAAADPTAKPAAKDAPFDPALFSRYMKFNEEMQLAGVLVASEGLNPGVQSAQVGVKGGKRVLLDGPFVESKELVGGFYLIDVASRDEAIAWALRAPTGMGSDAILTVHAMTNAADIPPDIMKLAREAAPTWTSSFDKGR